MAYRADRHRESDQPSSDDDMVRGRADEADDMTEETDEFDDTEDLDEEEESEASF